jgi:predicted transcriptional regulator
MKRSTIQNLASLEREMGAVARGERAPPVDAAKPSFNSADALRRLLTPAAQQMLARIRDRKPSSVPKK